MTAVSRKAGLTLVTDARSRTSWVFATATSGESHTESPKTNTQSHTQHRCGICVRRSSGGSGVGLFAARKFAKGEVLLRERWLTGMPLGDCSSSCSSCLRVCAFNPAEGAAGVGCSAGCGVRYCGPACRATAWTQHHQLLCVAAHPTTSSTHPLEVFRKHARLAPSAIHQKAEDALLAARMLAMCLTWADGAWPDANVRQQRETDVLNDDEEDDELPTAAALAAGVSAAASDGGAARSKVPPPFNTFASYCIVTAAQRAARQQQQPGAAADGAGACAKWVNDSFKLLMSSALGRHPRARLLLSPPVYSHALGLLDCNAACAAAMPAHVLQAVRAGAALPRGGPRSVEGFGLYPTFSCTQHACAPNAVNAKGAAADGAAVLENTLVLRATRAIAAGEELAFDYLDEAHDKGGGGGGGGGKEARRRRLKEHFGFECACAKCRAG